MFRIDPCNHATVGIARRGGTFQHVAIDPGDSSCRVLASYQLSTKSHGSVVTPSHKHWQAFYFVPNRPGQLLLSQATSGNILFTNLPLDEHEPSPVFMFGSHAGNNE